MLGKEDLIALVLAHAGVIAKLTDQATLLEKRLADLGGQARQAAEDVGQLLFK